MADNDTYTSPLVERNASKEMAELFSPARKFGTWRRIWLELARAEKKLGLDIKQTQIDQIDLAVQVQIAGRTDRLRDRHHHRIRRRKNAVRGRQFKGVYPGRWK